MFSLSRYVKIQLKLVKEIFVVWRKDFKIIGPLFCQNLSQIVNNSQIKNKLSF